MNNKNKIRLVTILMISVWILVLSLFLTVGPLRNFTIFGIIENTVKEEIQESKE